MPRAKLGVRFESETPEDARFTALPKNDGEVLGVEVLDAEPVTQEEVDEELAAEMADAPKDGRTLILVSAEGDKAAGYWRLTRSFQPSPQGRRWVPSGFWAGYPGTQKLPFDPVAWEEVKY